MLGLDLEKACSLGMLAMLGLDLESACGFGVLAKVRKSRVLILLLMTLLALERGETPSMSESCKAMEKGRART